MKSAVCVLIESNFISSHGRPFLLTCIVDEYIQLVKLDLNMLFDSLDGLLIRDIDLNRRDASFERVASFGSDLFQSPLSLLYRATAQ